MGPVSSDQLLELAAPLQAQATEMRAELAEIDAKRDELLASLRQIDGALGRLLPATAAKKRVRGAPSTNGRLVSEETVEEVLAFIEAHDEYRENGFIAGPVAKEMNLNGRPVGKDTVRKAVLVLHDRGVIRADRKTVGGGTLYKLVR